MDIRPVRTEADYNWALTEIEPYFLNEPKSCSADADRFDVLAALIAAYEDQHWAIETPEPIAAIQHWMDIHGYTQSDLATLIGSRSRASEVLKRKRPLTMAMANALHREWNIPAEILIKPYPLALAA